MDRVLRIVGVITVLVVVIISYRGFVQSVDQSKESTRTELDEEADDLVLSFAEEALDDRNDPIDEASVDGPPEYLAFSPEWQSRIYRVEPETNDEDGPAAPDRSRDDDEFPLETDLVTGQSLASSEPIVPGLYATEFGMTNCSYQLRRFGGEFGDRVIGQDRLRRGRVLVSLNAIEPDFFIAAPDCGAWSPWSPLVRPLVVAADGDYWSGDLRSGLWTVPEGCLWEKVVAFRGAELSDVVESAWGPADLVVDDGVLGIRIRNCDRPLQFREALPEPDDGDDG